MDRGMRRLIRMVFRGRGVRMKFDIALELEEHQIDSELIVDLLLIYDRFFQ